MKHRRRKGIRGLILALATAAVLVPAASGHIYEGGSTGYVDTAKAPGYTPQALKAMSERWDKRAEAYLASSSGYSPQALKALGAWYLKKTEAFQAARGASYGGLYPGSGAGPGSTVIRPDDRAGTRGIGTVSAPDYLDRQLANLQAKAALTAKALHADDRAGIRGPGPIETPVVASSHGDGFNWTDAGIGASAALVAALMLAAVMLIKRRERAGLAA